MTNRLPKKLQILVDEPEIQVSNPEDAQKNEFVHISENIAEIITNSKAQFTVGITGAWGTGKTTMMKTIQAQFKNTSKPNLKENPPNDKEFLKRLCDLKIDTASLARILKKKDHREQILSSVEETAHNIEREIFPTAWFNAWRFEQEDTKATIPLMITIIERLLLWANQYEYKFTVNNKNSIYEKLRNETVSFLNSCDHHFQITIPGVFTYDLNHSAKNKKENDLESKINYSLERIPKPVLQKGLDIIDQMISAIRKKEKEENRDFRLIVFVDDLDRCSPPKALEVLESIKVLLGIEGIVYVVGISDSTISRLIDMQYKGTGIEGKDYIKKIIQVKYPLRVWTANDIIELIKKNVRKELGNNTPSFLIPPETKIKNYEMISKVIEANPRELKRFLNRLILSFAIIKNEEGVNEEDLLIVEAFRSRWEDYFIQFTAENSSLKESIKEFIDYDHDEIRRKIEEEKKESSRKITMRDYTIMEKMPEDLWEFLKEVKEKLYAISPYQWELYLRATESIAKMDSTINDSLEDFQSKKISLLKTGRVEEFNKTSPHRVNLQHVNLQRLNLQHVNLQRLNLQDANFRGANLQDADLQDADLRGANLQDADLRGANLQRVYLQDADLRGANLQDADLQDVILQGVELQNVDLRGAKNLSITKKDAKTRGAVVN